MPKVCQKRARAVRIVEALRGQAAFAGTPFAADYDALLRKLERWHSGEGGNVTCVADMAIRFSQEVIRAGHDLFKVRASLLLVELAHAMPQMDWLKVDYLLGQLALDVPAPDPAMAAA